MKVSPSWIYWHTHSFNWRHINLCTQPNNKKKKKRQHKVKAEDKAATRLSGNQTFAEQRAKLQLNANNIRASGANVCPVYTTPQILFPSPYPPVHCLPATLFRRFELGQHRFLASDVSQLSLPAMDSMSPKWQFCLKCQKKKIDVMSLPEY